jgi:hypothetical protein
MSESLTGRDKSQSRQLISQSAMPSEGSSFQHHGWYVRIEIHQYFLGHYKDKSDTNLNGILYLVKE